MFATALQINQGADLSLRGEKTIPGFGGLNGPGVIAHLLSAVDLDLGLLGNGFVAPPLNDITGLTLPRKFNIHPALRATGSRHRYFNLRVC
jgi:hypothetical protein